MPRSNPQFEFMVSWSREGWPESRRKNRKLQTLKAAQLLANALERHERPDLPPARGIQVRQRTVGVWRVVARKGGAQ